MRIAAVIVVASALAATSAAADEIKRPTKEQRGENRAACERAAPTCDPSMLLSGLERSAVQRVLDKHPELVLEHAPYGKKIASVRVVAHEVFGPGDGFLRWFNIFHIATKELAVRRELTLSEGDTWDQLRLDESARRLRDPVSTGLVAIVALVAPGGAVELLVVTRDVWSLRANSVWQIQENVIASLSVSLSENNLLGMRRLLALSFRMDLGSIFLGPVYIDKNVAGKHIDLRARAGPLFNRDTQAYEGSESVFELSRPIYTLDQKWGVGLAWSHRDAIDRTFLGTALRTYNADETPEDDAQPMEFRIKKLSLALSAARGFGNDKLQHRARFGYEFAIQRPSVLPDFPDNPVLEESFTREVLPRSERTSQVFTGYELFEPRYRNTPNMQSYELAEETRMGVSAEARIGLSPRFLGSESSFVRLTGSVGYAGGLGDDGLWSVEAKSTTRLEGGEAIDTVVETTARLATPTFREIGGRFITQVRLSGLFHDTQNDEYTLGGDNGLRGFAINRFFGDRRAIWNTEFRTRPIPILFTRWGAVAFYDLGGIAQRLTPEDPRRTSRNHRLDGFDGIHHDVGFGLRVLLPQINTDVFRMDLALGLDDERRGKLRFSAGYDQTF